MTLSDAALLERTRSLCLEIRARLNRNPRLIIVNMDQTAVFYQMRPSTTIETIGARAVPVAMRASGSERVTVALTVTLAGEKLPPYVIFKGLPSGRIARELTSRGSEYPQGLIYTVQKSAWMDQHTVLDWITRYLNDLI